MCLQLSTNLANNIPNDIDAFFYVYFHIIRLFSPDHLHLFYSPEKRFSQDGTNEVLRVETNYV